jgi:hypothetical protein
VSLLDVLSRYAIIIAVVMDKILDKNGLEIEVGQIVKIKSNDVEDCVVCGFDNGRIDVIELGEGFTTDGDEIEVISELNG